MNYFFDTVGFEFENELMESFNEVCTREWGIGSFKFSTSQEDRYAGTDCFALGVPIDVTINYFNKRRMRKSKKTLSFDGTNVYYGIRYGNCFRTFKKPVLVIGIESAIEVTRDNSRDLVKFIRENIKEILEIGMDEYLAVVN